MDDHQLEIVGERCHEQLHSLQQTTHMATIENLASFSLHEYLQ
jgi:hypothetical protein